MSWVGDIVYSFASCNEVFFVCRSMVRFCVVVSTLLFVGVSAGFRRFNLT